MKATEGRRSLRALPRFQIHTVTFKVAPIRAHQLLILHARDTQDDLAAAAVILCRQQHRRGYQQSDDNAAHDHYAFEVPSTACRCFPPCNTPTLLLWTVMLRQSVGTEPTRCRIESGAASSAMSREGAAHRPHATPRWL